MARCILGLMLAAVLSTPLRAQSSDEDTARKWFLLGKKLSKQQKYGQALKAFQRAYRHWKHHVIHYNIALIYAFQGKRIAAATHLRQYLKKAKGGERRLPEVLSRVQRQVGVLVIRVPEAAASIYIDGRLAGRGRAERVVAPGKRTVTIKLGGRTVAHRNLVVAGGQEKVWELQTLPRKPIPPPKPPDRPSSRGIHRGYFIGTAAATVGLLAAAIGVSVKTKQLHDAYLRDDADSPSAITGVRYERAANSLWGLTAAAAATSVLLAIFTRWRPRERASPVSVTPLLGHRGVGLSLSWKR